jgi:biotin operon repressor
VEPNLEDVRRTAAVKPGKNPALPRHEGEMESVPTNQWSRLLLGEARRYETRIAEILSGCPTFELKPGEPHFRRSFLRAKLLAVEQGFVVVRSRPGSLARSIVTCDAGPGSLLLPPTDGEVLCGLVESRLIGITAEMRDDLLQVPGVGQALMELLEVALFRKQDALGNFAHTRHIERVRGKLLQLAASYGRVARDGIRIDFPLSHTLLAEMIGSSRETVTRALDELQRSGFVARRGHTYRLLVRPEQVLEPAGARERPPAEM